MCVYFLGLTQYTNFNNRFLNLFIKVHNTHACMSSGTVQENVWRIKQGIWTFAFSSINRYPQTCFITYKHMYVEKIFLDFQELYR